MRLGRHRRGDNLGTTVETWWPAILAFLNTRITNAHTEGLNRLVKQSKRSARGYHNPPTDTGGYGCSALDKAAEVIRKPGDRGRKERQLP